MSQDVPSSDEPEVHAAALVGAALPGGEYTVRAACNERILAATCADSELFPAAHPVFASVAGLAALGVGIGELCAMAGASIEEGPMLGECRLRFTRPLKLDEPYAVGASITSLVRKLSHQLGAMDLLGLTTCMSDASGEIAAEVEYTWVLPRRGTR
jgi:hypothetical protein